jgi:uncharacterized membrane protein YedE/YeeE
MEKKDTAFDEPLQSPVGPNGRNLWSPYVAGLGIGITLLLSLWFLGTGLGASGAFARLAAWIWHGLWPEHVASSAYFGNWFQEGSAHVLKYYLVFMAVGIFAGGLISALASRRIQPMLERGPRISARNRAWLALGGGVLVGFAGRLARGCTSGQGLTGGAMLFAGSVVFLLCMFIGAYITAAFVRGAWR